MDASDLRPNGTEPAAATGETAPRQQLEHQIDGEELLAKVLPAGEPLHPAIAAMVPLDNDGRPVATPGGDA